jgi:hypothetical protein
MQKHFLFRSMGESMGTLKNEELLKLADNWENFATPPLRGPHRDITPLPWELAAYWKI